MLIWEDNGLNNTAIPFTSFDDSKPSKYTRLIVICLISTGYPETFPQSQQPAQCTYLRGNQESPYNPFLFFPVLTIPQQVFLSCLLIWISHSLFAVLFLHKILTCFCGGSLMMRKRSTESFTEQKGLVLLRISGPRLPDLFIDCVF